MESFLVKMQAKAKVSGNVILCKSVVLWKEQLQTPDGVYILLFLEINQAVIIICLVRSISVKYSNFKLTPREEWTVKVHGTMSETK